MDAVPGGWRWSDKDHRMRLSIIQLTEKRQQQEQQRQQRLQMQLPQRMTHERRQLQHLQRQQPRHQQLKHQQLKHQQLKHQPQTRESPSFFSPTLAARPKNRRESSKGNLPLQCATTTTVYTPPTSASTTEVKHPQQRCFFFQIRTSSSSTPLLRLILLLGLFPMISPLLPFPRKMALFFSAAMSEPMASTPPVEMSAVTWSERVKRCSVKAGKHETIEFQAMIYSVGNQAMGFEAVVEKDMCSLGSIQKGLGEDILADAILVPCTFGSESKGKAVYYSPIMRQPPKLQMSDKANNDEEEERETTGDTMTMMSDDDSDNDDDGSDDDNNDNFSALGDRSSEKSTRSVTNYHHGSHNASQPPASFADLDTSISGKENKKKKENEKDKEQAYKRFSVSADNAKNGESQATSLRTKFKNLGIVDSLKKKIGSRKPHKGGSERSGSQGETLGNKSFSLFGNSNNLRSQKPSEGSSSVPDSQEQFTALTPAGSRRDSDPNSRQTQKNSFADDAVSETYQESSTGPQQYTPPTTLTATQPFQQEGGDETIVSPPVPRDPTHDERGSQDVMKLTDGEKTPTTERLATPDSEGQGRKRERLESSRVSASQNYDASQVTSPATTVELKGTNGEGSSLETGNGSQAPAVSVQEEGNMPTNSLLSVPLRSSAAASPDGSTCRKAKRKELDTGFSQQGENPAAEECGTSGKEADVSKLRVTKTRFPLADAAVPEPEQQQQQPGQVNLQQLQKSHSQGLGQPLQENDSPSSAVNQSTTPVLGGSQQEQLLQRGTGSEQVRAAGGNTSLKSSENPVMTIMQEPLQLQRQQEKHVGSEDPHHEKNQEIQSLPRNTRKDKDDPSHMHSSTTSTTSSTATPSVVTAQTTDTSTTNSAQNENGWRKTGKSNEDKLLPKGKKDEEQSTSSSPEAQRDKKGGDTEKEVEGLQRGSETMEERKKNLEGDGKRIKIGEIGESETGNKEPTEKETGTRGVAAEEEKRMNVEGQDSSTGRGAGTSVGAPISPDRDQTVGSTSARGGGTKSGSQQKRKIEQNVKAADSQSEPSTSRLAKGKTKGEKKKTIRFDSEAVAKVFRRKEKDRVDDQIKKSLEKAKNTPDAFIELLNDANLDYDLKCGEEKHRNVPYVAIISLGFDGQLRLKDQYKMSSKNTLGLSPQDLQ